MPKSQSRPDRLFTLISILRDGRLHRASDLAAQLGVSLRSIYRDMDTLASSGVPVSGERGLGYQMTAPVTLPPLNLSKVELEALHLGMAVVSEAEDAELRDAARSLSAKIDAVLPPIRKIRAYFNMKAWQSPASYIKWQGACGTFEGQATLNQ